MEDNPATKLMNTIDNIQVDIDNNGQDISDLDARVRVLEQHIEQFESIKRQV